jgi:hypothetical protein
MTWPPDFIQGLAPKIASARKETLKEAEVEQDPVEKARLEARADRLQRAYDALHGLEVEASPEPLAPSLSSS